MLSEIDERAGSLKLSRSRYLTLLAQHDIKKGGPLLLPTQDEPEPVVPVELNAIALEFLKFAIPALTQYQDNHGQCPDPQVPDHIAKTYLWQYYIKQRRAILNLKWDESRKDGDIGISHTLYLWLQKNQELWAFPQPTPSL